MNVHIVSVDEHIVYEQFKMRPDHEGQIRHKS